MIARTAIVGAALVTMVACGQSVSSGHGQPASSTASVPVAETATPPSQFASRAAMFETYQIQAAQIAQRNAQSAAARAYATAAVAEHQSTLQRLNGAVQAAGMPAPSGALDENYNAYLDMLHHADAQTFDSTYASQQALAYMSASGLYDSFTSTAPASPLKQWALSQSPHVHDGITAARQLARDAGH